MSNRLLDAGWRRSAGLCVQLCATAIILLTLFPYRFSPKREVPDPPRRIMLLGIGQDHIWDVVENVLLYLPLGFSLSLLLESKGRITIRTPLYILAIGFGLSYSIEITQNFIPQRYPSIVDVMSNSTGALLGFATWCFLPARRAEPPRHSPH